MTVVIADWVRPRWGIGCVRLHLDVEDLALALLLFDRIVMPTPENDAEFERWRRVGWKPEKLAFRVNQLGDLVHKVPWKEALRSQWESRWEKLQEIGRETEALAYSYTPDVIAMSAWNEVCQRTVNEGRAPEQPPIPVAWYPAADIGTDALQVSADRVQTSLDDVGRQVGLLFRRELEYPLREYPEEALEVAYHLAVTDDFVVARRALFEWEALVATQALPVADALQGLVEAAATYDEMVKAHAGRTLRKAVNVLVPAAASKAAAMTGIPLAAGAAGGLARRVTARFVPLPPVPDPKSEVGAALSTARRAMSAVYSA